MTAIKRFIKDYKNKKVLIMGFGLQGRGVQDAIFFAEIGAKVLVTDLKTKKELIPSINQLKNLDVKMVLGQHRKKDILSADLILRNAAVPWNYPYLNLARKRKIAIEMDESLFARYAEVKIIGITGTRGKSTTTTLIFNILKNAGLSVYLGGNILGIATLPLLKKIKKNDILIAELSSWQLQGFGQNKISPYMAVMTNIYQDHLNHYSSMKSYIEDKKTIFKYQTKKDFLFLNYDDERLRKLAKQAKSQVVYYNKSDFPKNLKLKIRGDHNKLNIVAALKVIEVLKVNKQVALKTIADFKGLPFRLETIANIKGVEYINDSTSTTPAAGIAALTSFSKPVLLIAGGSSKNLNMSLFAKMIAQKVKSVVFLKGEETNNLSNLVKKYGGKEKIIGTFPSIKDAVLEIKTLAKTGDAVLLSPGCASFGMFKNEFDRGKKFNQLISSFKK